MNESPVGFSLQSGAVVFAAVTLMRFEETQSFYRAIGYG
jgi:hypothetical protein